tara:strand:+ start:337 stop:519 length:183 start_codon:yes stop_codon:yes gene_type:complete
MRITDQRPVVSEIQDSESPPEEALVRHARGLGPVALGILVTMNCLYQCIISDGFQRFYFG